MSLSRPSEGRLTRTWISLLHGRVQASLAATTGVEHVADLVVYLLAGADVVMTTSALLRHGPKRAQALLDGLEDWLQHKGFDSVDKMRGLLATPSGEDHTEHERSGYVSAMRKANTGVYGSWWASNRRHG